MGAGPLVAPAPAPPDIDVLASTFGLDATGAEVLRAATRHVVRFPASKVLTFAVPGGTTGPRQEAAIATLLADAGVPAARRLAGPAPIDGWWVTAWREIPTVPDAPPVDAATIAALATRLHTATGGLDPRGIVECDPLGAGLAQLEVAIPAGRTSDDELAILRRAATRLETVWQAALDEARAAPAGTVAGGAVLHGDLHAGNVVIGPRGPVLVDLELAGWGPRAYDAAPTVAFVRWYGYPAADLADFDATYGAPLTEAAREGALDEVWALWSTCWCVANRHRSAALEEEAQVRLATVATGEAPTPWQLR
ncbi:MAG TPA: aminoglycoside phosphotransferase family protein [Iamia sp.]|nr:aminoglycoside phosphotransferase family protein [Iamia sp.]